MMTTTTIIAVHYAVEHRHSLLSRVSRRRTWSNMRGTGSHRRTSAGRNIDAAELSDRMTRVRQQTWIVPPFYRVFWFFHNVSLIATPVSFGMFITQLYEGKVKLKRTMPEWA